MAHLVLGFHPTLKLPEHWLHIRDAWFILKNSLYSHRNMFSCIYYYDFSRPLTHWGRVTHICVSKQTSIGSDNGLSPDRRQAIIWTNVGILLIGPLGTNFSEISNEIHILSFRKILLKISSGKWRLFCLGLNELTVLNSWSSMVKRYLLTQFLLGILLVTN